MVVSDEVGGCPCQDTNSLSTGVSPIIVDRRETTNSFTKCPICGGELAFGSRDPCEGDFYWCLTCNNGPISFPLYEKPVKKIAAIIDADKVQETALIERLLAQGRRYQETGDVRSFSRPVIIPPEPSSPHSYLDDLMSGDAMVRAVQRVNVDRKFARASIEKPCDSCFDISDCPIAHDVTAPERCDRLQGMLK